MTVLFLQRKPGLERPIGTRGVIAIATGTEDLTLTGTVCIRTTGTVRALVRGSLREGKKESSGETATPCSLTTLPKTRLRFFGVDHSVGTGITASDKPVGSVVVDFFFDDLERLVGTREGFAADTADIARETTLSVREAVGSGNFGFCSGAFERLMRPSEVFVADSSRFFLETTGASSGQHGFC